MDNSRSVAIEMRVASVRSWICCLTLRQSYLNSQLSMMNGRLGFSKQGGIYYRGQSNDEWSLQTTLERFFNKRGYDWCDTDRVFEFENKFARKFKETLIKYKKTIPDKNVEVCMMMQHYGLPTRMLDLSTDFMTALFFATREGEGDFAIWEIYDDGSIGVGSPSDFPVEFICPSRFLDERISSQFAAFVRQNRLGCSFMEALSDGIRLKSSCYIKNMGMLRADSEYSDVIRKDNKLIKWVFPHDARQEVKSILAKSAKSADRVFPDIYGAVEAIISESDIL